MLRLGFDGNLASSITIRTALMQGQSVYYWAGGGIVADSDCDDEYQESLDKAAAILRLVSYPLMPRHVLVGQALHADVGQSPTYRYRTVEPKLRVWA